MDYSYLSGFLNVYKEPGWTSHDVCAYLRRALHVKKVGHAGTLDPLAEGVLLVALGRATKDIALTASWPKTYRATLLLGRTTDTQDTSGRTLSETPIDPAISAEQVSEALMSFVGDYEQLTPMYSARKVSGRPLYKYARAGESVERRIVSVTIYDITIESIELPRVTFTATVSGGTYIRTLCEDIGERLHCGGCMESLVRLGVGRFGADTAMRVRDIASYPNVDALLYILCPTAVSIGKFDGVHLGHRALLDKLKRVAREEGLRTLVIVLRGSGETILSDGERRRRTLEQGIDFLLELEFNEELKSTSAMDFLRMLCSRFNVRAIVAGEDISFGRGREGDGAFLLAHAEELGVTAHLIGKLRSDDEDAEISSTLVRDKIAMGENEAAERLLGGPIG